MGNYPITIRHDKIAVKKTSIELNENRYLILYERKQARHYAATTLFCEIDKKISTQNKTLASDGGYPNI